MEADFRVHSRKQQAALLADEKIPALILYGKYSMRIYLDRCAELGTTGDVIGIYHEWTFAAAQPFKLCGVILERAEETVRGAVTQLLAECSGAPLKHLSIKAEFLPASSFHTIKVADLANQLLFEHADQT